MGHAPMLQIKAHNSVKINSIVFGCFLSRKLKKDVISGESPDAQSHKHTVLVALRKRKKKKIK